MPASWQRPYTFAHLTKGFGARDWAHPATKSSSTRQGSTPGAVRIALQRPHPPASVAADNHTMQGDHPTAQQLKDQAVQAAENGEFDAAAAHFAAVLDLCPNDAALHEQHAQCLMEMEQYDAAMTAAERATIIEPQWPDAWTTLARCYLNAGQLNHAQAAFSTSLALDSDQPGILQELNEVVELARLEISRRVGLQGLQITADPAGQLGPGCVIWEAGIVLAQLLVAHTKSMQQQPQPQQQAISGVVDNSSIGETDTPLASGLSDAVAAAVGHTPDVASAAPQIAAAAAAATSADSSATPCVRGYPCWCTTGAHVLEVGSGTGILGITAAALGAHVTLTDLPELQQLLSNNVAANQQLIEAAGVSASVEILDWTNIDQMLDDLACSSAVGSSSGSRVVTDEHVLRQQYDWAMGADLVFNQHQVVPVVHLIAALLGAGPCSCLEPQQGAVKRKCSGCEPSQAGLSQQQQEQQQCVVQTGFLLAHKHRHELVDQQLTDALTRAGLNIDTVVTSYHDRRPEQHASVSVWWLTKQGASKCQQDVKDISSHQPVGPSGKQRQLQQPDLQQLQLQPQIVAQGEGLQQQCGSTGDALASPQCTQQQQQQEKGTVHVSQPQKLLLLSAGLAGVGKSTILKQLCAGLGPSTVYVDKDTINAAMLQGRPYFSDYYKQHVQQQAYAVMFAMAADNLVAKDGCAVILDGQFGEKLSAEYIQPYWQAIQHGRALPFAQAQSSQCEQQQQHAEAVAARQAHHCRVVLVVFECGAELQLQRLMARGLERDEGKYADFDGYRSKELLLLGHQLQQVAGQLDGCIRIDTSKTVAECSDLLFNSLSLLL